MEDNIILKYDTVTERKIPVIFLYPPEGKNLPVVLVNHGTYGNAETMLDMAAALARKGILAVAIDALWHGRRGSEELSDMVNTSEYKEKYLFMLKEMSKDMSALIDMLKQNPLADANRIGMTGISQGGYVAFMTMVNDNRIKAAAPLIGSPDLSDKYGQSYEWEVYSDQVKDRIIDAMPLTHYKKMSHVSLLIQNSASDTVVPITGTRRLDKLLRPLYNESGNYKYIEYFGIGHEATPTMKKKAVDWLAEKL